MTQSTKNTPTRFTSSLLSAAILALPLLACNATGPCSQHFSNSSEIQACRVGAEEVAPKVSSIQEADLSCSKKFDVRSIDAGDTAWFEKATQMADLYNACHFGAAGRMVVESHETIQSIEDEGCLQVVMPGRNVTCR